MNDTYIVTTYVVIDDLLKAWNFEDDCRASGHAAETLTVAVLEHAGISDSLSIPQMFCR